MTAFDRAAIMKDAWARAHRASFWSPKPTSAVERAEWRRNVFAKALREAWVVAKATAAKPAPCPVRAARVAAAQRRIWIIESRADILTRADLAEIAALRAV